MTTFTLIVALFVGAGWSNYPWRVETYMEKGYINRDACVRAAVPYDALARLKLPHGTITVSWECVEVKS